MPPRHAHSEDRTAQGSPSRTTHETSRSPSAPSRALDATQRPGPARRGWQHRQSRAWINTGRARACERPKKPTAAASRTMADTGDVAAAAEASARPAGSSSTQPLAGRVAIVTGASRGIGRAIATHLSSLGASLVLGYAARADEAGALAASLPRAVAVRADVSDEAGARSLFDAADEAFGGAHILVASAGVLDDTYPAVAGTATEAFDRVLAVNLRGAFLCLREAANRLRRGGGGRIVAVTSSVVGSLPPRFGAYTASKAAVEALVRTMAKELGGTRVTANCVAPGATATDMFFKGKSEAMVRHAVETNPMQRLGEPGDIAPVVGFLCTDAAEWVNGQVIRANGGYV
jgi:3-oxoacyl-[acyl-carrier protein] reductase|uniref:Ketoreductase domain-containing protein n=2 Tax=Zea mays TaxID=4577 RepID=A0A804Q6X9_MAIZE